MLVIMAIPKPPVFLQMKLCVMVFHLQQLFYKMAILLILMLQLLKMVILVIPVVCITWVQLNQRPKN